MSWLRRQTPETFVRHHPGWEMHIHTSEPGSLHGHLPLDTQSDLARWEILEREGGWFSDLDIIYLDSISARLPDAGAAMLTQDGGTGGRFAIGLVGAEARHPWISALREAALRRATPEDHQSAGSRCILEEWDSLPEPRPDNLPSKLLYPLGFLSSAVARLWHPGEDVSLDGLLGLHWGGGHVRSQVWERHLTADNWQQTEMPVTRALRRALRTK